MAARKARLKGSAAVASSRKKSNSSKVKDQAEAVEPAVPETESDAEAAAIAEEAAEAIPQILEGELIPSEDHATLDAGAEFDKASEAEAEA
ncbi:MAG: hypothetical protein KJO15_09480, partial [Alphaproteobacteria bacterium]|nr:hypothetical protein [Alphaproteobacteria bacterium]